MMKNVFLFFLILGSDLEFLFFLLSCYYLSSGKRREKMFSNLYPIEDYAPLPIKPNLNKRKSSSSSNILLDGSSIVGSDSLFPEKENNTEDDGSDIYLNLQLPQKPVLRCPSDHFYKEQLTYNNDDEEEKVQEEGEEREELGEEKTIRKKYDQDHLFFLDPIFSPNNDDEEYEKKTSDFDVFSSSSSSSSSSFSLMKRQKSTQVQQQQEQHQQHQASSPYSSSTISQKGEDNTNLIIRPRSSFSSLVFDARSPSKLAKAKKQPTTPKARRVYEQKQTYNQFVQEIPILTTRPFLRNEDNLFGNIMILMDACVIELLFPKETSIAGSSGENTFLQFFNESIFMNSQHNYNRGSDFDLSLHNSHHKPYFFSFLSLSKNHNNILSIYYHKLTNRLLVIDFDNGKPDPLLTKEALLKQGVLWSKHTPFQPYVDIRRISWLTQKYMAQGFEMATTCKKKIWHIILLLLVAKHQRHPHEVLDTFFNPNTPTETICWLHSLFSQSILYFALDNEEVLSRRIKKFCPVSQQTVVEKLFASIKKQCGIKPIVSATHGSKRKNKEGNIRIGKFKGSQTEQIFCVIVNGNVGVHATFEKLCTTNIFALLMQASSMTNESEFNYNDLCNCLPDFFQEDKSNLFPSEFELKTPYVTTRDPIKCFGPIIYTLWPLKKAKNKMIENLVTLNDKKWKIDLEIKIRSNQEQQQTQNVIMARFISQLELCAKQPQTPYPLQEYVSIIDEETSNPLLGGFYYHDPTHDLEMAKQRLYKCDASTFETTQYQELYKIPTPIPSSRLCSLNMGMGKRRRRKTRRSGQKQTISVNTEENDDDNDDDYDDDYDEEEEEEEDEDNNYYNATGTKVEKKDFYSSSPPRLQLIYFRRDPFHNIWQGSRIVGIAVRRFLKKNPKMLIRTFPSTEKFQETMGEGWDRHFFLLLPNKQSFYQLPPSSTSFCCPVLTVQNVVQLYSKLPKGQALLCLDDIGMPKIYMYGNLPLKCDDDNNNVENTAEAFNSNNKSSDGKKNTSSSVGFAHDCELYNCIFCSVCSSEVDDYKWLQTLQSDASAKSILPWNTPLFHGKHDSCLYLKDSLPDSTTVISTASASIVVINGEEDCAGITTVTTKDQLVKLSNGTVHAMYYLGAMRSTKIQYLSSFQELQQKIYQQVLTFAEQNLGLLRFACRDSLLFEILLSPKCSCCRQGSICLTALGACILLVGISSGYKIRNNYSNLELLVGKKISFDFLKRNSENNDDDDNADKNNNDNKKGYKQNCGEKNNLPLGLRCKHDWRKGVTNLKVNTIIQHSDAAMAMTSSNLAKTISMAKENNSNNNGIFDILITSNKKPTAIYGCRTLRLIF